jgi:hypothetical protein
MRITSGRRAKKVYEINSLEIETSAHNIMYNSQIIICYRCKRPRRTTGSEISRLSHFIGNRLIDGGEAVSLRRPL